MISDNIAQKKKVSLLFLLFFVGSCVPPAIVNQTFGPDGRQAYSIVCSGDLHHWGTCYEKAGQLCGSRGYTIIEKISDYEDKSSIDTSTGNRREYTFVSRHLIISCR